MRQRPNRVGTAVASQRGTRARATATGYPSVRCSALQNNENGITGTRHMLRIFRHYIPKTLILLGIAELLILFSSIYLGASFHLGVDPHKAYAAIGGANMPLWVQALVFAGAIGLGMMSMGPLSPRPAYRARGRVAAPVAEFPVRFRPHGCGLPGGAGADDRWNHYRDRIGLLFRRHRHLSPDLHPLSRS